MPVASSINGTGARCLSNADFMENSIRRLIPPDRRLARPSGQLS